MFGIFSVSEKFLKELAEENKAAESEMEDESESKLKEYGYRLALKCHVSVAEIEWTTETTDEELNTSVKTKSSFYKAPEEEVDPE